MILWYASGEQGFLRIGPFGQKFRGKIFPFVVREFSDFKADSAALHHAKKGVLVIYRVVRPDEQLKILPAKTSVEFLELFEAFVPMKDSNRSPPEPNSGRVPVSEIAGIPA